jgi:hypothetical protein
VPEEDLSTNGFSKPTGPLKRKMWRLTCRGETADQEGGGREGKEANSLRPFVEWDL